MIILGRECVEMKKQIQSIQDLIDHGEFKKAEKLYNEIEIEILEEPEKIDIGLLRGEILSKKREISELEGLITQLEHYKLSFKDTIRLILLKSSCLFVFGRFPEQLGLLEPYEDKIRKFPDKNETIQQLHAKVYLEMGAALVRMGKGKEAFDFFSKSLKLSKKINYKRGNSVALSTISMYFSTKGEIDDARKKAEASLELGKNIGDKDSIIRSYWALGWALHHKGKHQEAIECGNNSLKYATETGNVEGIYNAHFSLAYFYESDGNLDQALSSVKESVVLCDKLGLGRVRAILRNREANILRIRGNIDEALGLYEENLKIFEEVKEKRRIAYTHWDIASIYSIKKEYGNSKQYFQKSLEYFEKIDYDNDLLRLFTVIIRMGVASNDKEFSNRFLKKLKILDETQKKQVTSERYQFCQALVLKTSNRFRNKAKAQELFLNSLDSDMDFEYKISSLLNLCDMLIDELIFSREEEVLDELGAFLDDIEAKAKKANAYVLSVKILEIRSKFTLIAGKTEAALRLLESALEKSKELNLNYLITDIQQQKELIENNLDEFEEIFASDAPIEKKLDKLHLRDTFTDTINIFSTREFSLLPSEKCTIFFSYAKEDSEEFKIKQIAKKLELKSRINKVHCFELCNGVYPGGSWVTFMNLGIEDSQFLIPFFTEWYDRSTNCKKEYEAGIALDKAIIPIFKDKKYIPPINKATVGVEIQKFDHEEVVNKLYNLVKGKLELDSV